jgi:hypothetical protein
VSAGALPGQADHGRHQHGQDGIVAVAHPDPHGVHARLVDAVAPGRVGVGLALGEQLDREAGVAPLVLAFARQRHDVEGRLGALRRFDADHLARLDPVVDVDGQVGGGGRALDGHEHPEAAVGGDDERLVDERHGGRRTGARRHVLGGGGGGQGAGADARHGQQAEGPTERATAGASDHVEPSRCRVSTVRPWGSSTKPVAR